MAENTYAYTQSPMYVGNAGTDYQWIGNKLVNTNDVVGLQQNYGLAASQVPEVKFNTGTSTVGKNALLNSGAEMQRMTPKTSLGTGGEKSWIDTIGDWFKPGVDGASTGGNIMKGIGDGVGAAAGLAGMYYAKKNYDLQEDQQKYLQNREAQDDTRKSKFAANAGNGAVY